MGHSVGRMRSIQPNRRSFGLSSHFWSEQTKQRHPLAWIIGCSTKWINNSPGWSAFGQNNIIWVFVWEHCVSIRLSGLGIQSNEPLSLLFSFFEVSNGFRTLRSLWKWLGMCAKAPICTSNLLIRVSKPQTHRTWPWNVWKHLKWP